jgi:hypothetical protein
LKRFPLAGGHTLQNFFKMPVLHSQHPNRIPSGSLFFSGFAVILAFVMFVLLFVIIIV